MHGATALTLEEIREALLRALAIDGRGEPRPGAQLLRHDAEEAALLLPVSGECVVFRVVEDGDAAGLEALRARLVALRQAASGSRLNVVVLGGGSSARRVLKEAGSFWGTSPLALFQATTDGRLWCDRRFGPGATAVRPVLNHALQRIVASGAAPVLTLEQQHALRQKAQPDSAEGREQAAFWTALARRRPWASWSLAAFAAMVFLLEEVWGGSTFSPTLYRMGADVRDRVLAGEVFRLFSSAFLHIGVPHAVVNLWALIVVGPFLEKVLGTGRFLVLYALSALGGSLASVAVGRSGLSAGASGALWGLLVGSFALSQWPRGVLPDAVRRLVQTRTWQPLVANFLLSFLPFIDRYAHFGGGLAGGLLIATGALTRGVRRRGATEPAPAAPAPTDAGVKALAALLSVLMVGSVVAALVTGRPWELRTPPASRPLDLPGTPFALDVPEGMSVAAVPAGDDPNVSVFEIGDPLRHPVWAQVAIAPAVSDAADAGPVVAQTRTLDAQTRGLGAEGLRSQTTRAGLDVQIDVAWYPEASRAWRAAGDRLARSLRTTESGRR